MENELVEKFLKRIDADSGYDNISLAQDLVEIVEQLQQKQLPADEEIKKIRDGLLFEITDRADHDSLTLNLIDKAFTRIIEQINK